MPELTVYRVVPAPPGGPHHLSLYSCQEGEPAFAWLRRVVGELKPAHGWVYPYVTVPPDHDLGPNGRGLIPLAAAGRPLLVDRFGYFVTMEAVAKAALRGRGRGAS